MSSLTYHGYTMAMRGPGECQAGGLVRDELLDRAVFQTCVKFGSMYRRWVGGTRWRCRASSDRSDARSKGGKVAVEWEKETT